MIATGTMKERVSADETSVVFIRLQNKIIIKLLLFQIHVFPFVHFLERQIKVQFCTDPLSQVIHYETDR